MSIDNKRRIDDFFNWLQRGAIVVNIWFLAQTYSDFQALKVQFTEVMVKVSALENSIELIKNFDLKPKR